MSLKTMLNWESNKDKNTLRRLAGNFFLSEDVLYKRNFDMVLLRCLDRHEANMLMQEVYEGSFGTHVNGHAMAKKMLKASYYGMTMEPDCCKYVSAINVRFMLIRFMCL